MNATIKRNFVLEDVKLSKYKELTKTNGKLEVPYQKTGVYYGICKSLSNLGENEWHSLVSLKEEMQKVMSLMPTSVKGINAWNKFVLRTNRNDITGKDIIGKIIQNAEVLQRVINYNSNKENNNPYGYKLQQLCYCVDIKKEDGMYNFRINNQFIDEVSVKPLKAKG